MPKNQQSIIGFSYLPARIIICNVVVRRFSFGCGWWEEVCGIVCTSYPLYGHLQNRYSTGDDDFFDYKAYLEVHSRAVLS
jgi:hypothetical protein